MKNATIYSFDENAKLMSVESTFARFEMKLKEQDTPTKRGMFYIDEDMNTLPCKYLGYAAKNKIVNNDIVATVAEAEAKQLKEIRNLLMKPNYTKIIDGFNEQLNKIKSNLTNAKKDAAGKGDSQAQLQNARITCQDLVNKVNTHIDDVSSDDHVITLKQKIDKFIQKKQVIYDSQFYTMGPASTGAPISGVDIMVNSQSVKNNNIDAAIAESKKTSEASVNKAFDEFKNLIRSILQATTSVGVMLVSDGKYDDNHKSERIININSVVFDDILYMKNREKLVFVSPK